MSTERFSMSWVQFIASVLFSFLGIKLISLFVIIPITNSIFNDTALESLQGFLEVSLVNLCSLVLFFMFIYVYTPVKKLVLPAFNYQTLKKWSTY